jgi:hypothetical protein
LQQTEVSLDESGGKTMNEMVHLKGPGLRLNSYPAIRKRLVGRKRAIKPKMIPKRVNCGAERHAWQEDSHPRGYATSWANVILRLIEGRRGAKNWFNPVPKKTKKMPIVHMLRTTKS